MYSICHHCHHVFHTSLDLVVKYLYVRRKERKPSNFLSNLKNEEKTAGNAFINTIYRYYRFCFLFFCNSEIKKLVSG